MAEHQARLRVAELSDAKGILALFERGGFGSQDIGAWRHTWESNPFRDSFSGVPIGWVLESAHGEIVGSISNVHMMFEYNRQPLRGVICAAWIVEKDYRSQSLQLQHAFRKQAGVDLWMVTSANPVASKLFRAFNATPVPAPGFVEPFLYPVNRYRFVRAALRRRGVTGASALAAPGALALLLREAWCRTISPGIKGHVYQLPEFDETFDSFWENLRAESGRLRAIRTRAALAWRFHPERLSGHRTILCAGAPGKLEGYAVMAERRLEGDGVKFWDILDIQALNDDPAVISDLLAASMREARRAGMDAVKLVCSAPAKKLAASRLKPQSYRVDHWPIYFRIISQDLPSSLASPEDWDLGVMEVF